MLQCCSAPAHWSGDEGKTQEAISLLEKNWQKMGKPLMILACSSCMEMFKTYLPKISVTSLWEIMDQCDLPDTSCKGNGINMALHDPCTTRNDPRIQEAARSLIGKLGFNIKELEFSRQKTECCGFGGLMENANPAMAKKQLERRTSESKLNFLTYCAMCRESIKGAGKPTAHLLDFIFPRTIPDSDPVQRPKTGLSQSRENRARLKQSLLKDIWQKKTGTGKKIEIYIPLDVQEKLEQRRILDQDIRGTMPLLKNGQKMQSFETDFSGLSPPLRATSGLNIHR